MWLNCGGRSNSCGISCWRWRSRKRPRYPRPGVANWSSVSGGRIGAANGIGSVRPVNEESRPKAGRHLSHFSPRPPLLRDFTKESMIFFLNCQTLWRRWGCHQKVWLPMLSSEPAPSSPRPWRSARRDPPGQFQTTKGEKRPELSVIFSNDPTIPSSVTPLNDLTGAQPELWSLLDGLPQTSHPRFLRGDGNWGTERAMEGAEQRGLAYVFKLKQSANVKRLIAQLFGDDHWVDAGEKWQGLDTELQLSGWNKKRRVVVLRRPLRSGVAAETNSKKKAAQQICLELPEALYRGVLYEYAVLVTSLQDEVRTIAQHYRDRGDSENNFDELKNQWGWAGFTTHDRNRCQVMARITALVYNWWTVFLRLGIPEKHAEAITSRPLALYGIARRRRHGNQTKVEVTSTHSKASAIAAALSKVNGFLQRIKANAEQLSPRARWRLILSAAFQYFLRGKVLGGTGRLAQATG